MSTAWFQYEARIIGRGANLGPLVAIAGIGLVALLMSSSGTSHDRIASVLTSTLELGIPLVTGMLATFIASSDLAVELQRTVETRYPTTLLRRIGILAAWSGTLAAFASLVLIATDFWVVPESAAIGQLSWLAPMAWFIGAGILFASLLRSWSAAVSLLGGVWLIQNVLESWFLERDWARSIFLFMSTHQPTADDWASTRLTVAGTGLLLGAIGMMIKSRTERLDAGGDE